MTRRGSAVVGSITGFLFFAAIGAADVRNLVADGSFEQSNQRDQFGHVFNQWGGWKYEGECEFRVGRVAHGGKTSCLLFGGGACKIRIAQTLKAVPAGRYKVTAFVRGLDVGEGAWRMSTEFAFNGNYIPIKKNGTFGWTPMTYVAEVKAKRDFELAFGLWAPGYFWIDDVSVVPVGDETALTMAPSFGRQESPVEPPNFTVADAVRCPDCGYRNSSKARTCYACGAEMKGVGKVDARPALMTLASFEDKNPFDGGLVVAEHASDGAKSLRIDKGYVVWNGPQDWSGYDYLTADLYTDSDKPLSLSLEIADQQTRDYWTRVNFETLVAPGKSKLFIPLQQLYVGEKARPGRNLLLSGVTRLALIVGDKPAAPLYVDHLRLERDQETAKMKFDGLHAFSFGPSNGPLMQGFTRIDPSTVYSKGRGYGLADVQIWRAFDARQPDLLYQNFLCIEKGGLQIDVPNGRYHVFVNIDNPAGFWGEYQTYKQRSILAQGRPVVEESMTFGSFQKKYFRHWNVEDLPADDVFDKYQRTAFHEKEFDVDVRDGKLRLDFRGENWACSVSAVIVYPVEKADLGRKFLDYVMQKRRFFFDNYFHRILHKPTGGPLSPTPVEVQRGAVVFSRDYMEDVYYNDAPRKTEVDKTAHGFAFAGQFEPLTVAILPLVDLGGVRATISDLTGPGVITAKNITVGYVSYRLKRVSADGAVYTIAPRLILPRERVAAPQGIARRFWFTVETPADAKPGVYRGNITFTAERAAPFTTPVEFRVYRGLLDAVDVPVGPFSHTIDTPWDGADPAAKAWNRTMAERSLRKLHDYGFTTFTGMPEVRYLGFRNGKPHFDFTEADRQMTLARACGFTMPVVTYTAMPGLDLYRKDQSAMSAAGFTDYTRFARTLFTAIQSHATAANWLPLYWNLGDEPVGDDLVQAAENAEAYRAAAPVGPPWFTAPTSFDSGDAKDPHFRFARALHAPALNNHSEAAVELIQSTGSDWGFYNGGNRWTYGVYMYKAAKQFDMKFRIGWHWNAAAGDPYYALDCREDDYAWCSANPDGELIPSVAFEREMRAGIDDYRCILTLARLAKKKHDGAAQALIDERMASFKLGQRDHDALFPVSDYREHRRKLAEAIARLRVE